MPEHPGPEHPGPEHPGPEHPGFHPDLGGYVLGTLEPSEREAFEAHLGTCEVCRAEVEELSVLPPLLRRATTAAPAQPPAGLRERTFAAVERAAAERAAAERAAAGTAERPASAAQPALAPAPARAGARPWGRYLAIAAAVLVVGAAAGVIRQVNQPSTAVAEVQLVAADGGPASGVARVRTTAEGREVELDVRDLPPTPAGSYYECWFVGDGDTLEKPNRVSVGTFRVGPDGHASVRMFSAAAADRFPRMGVTLEPDDGNPARTGPKVLTSK